jgi:hypothetical protein
VADEKHRLAHGFADQVALRHSPIVTKSRRYPVQAICFPFESVDEKVRIYKSML